MTPTSRGVVSVLLPTYNRGGDLHACVESVVSQTFERWELVICDDASTDSTREIACRWSATDRRIRYFRNSTNIGLPASRNAGICRSVGDLILFIEDDVMLEPNCVQILVETFADLGARGEAVGAIAPSRPYEWSGEEASRGSVLDYAWRRSNERLPYPCSLSGLTGLVRSNFAPHFVGLREVPCVHPCSLYPRAVLEEVGGYDATTYKGNYLYEEMDLNVRLRQRGYKLYFQPVAVMRHRLGESGGCRVAPARYAYYFVLNHIKFVRRNFGVRCLWMVPSFVAVSAAVALRAVGAYALHDWLPRQWRHLVREGDTEH